MQPKYKRRLLPLAVVAAFGATILAPRRPPVGGSWEAVLGAAFAGLLGLGGVAVAWYGGTLFWVGRSLQGQDADSTVHAADGERVVLEGTARPHEGTLPAPVTGTECLAHEYAVHAQHKTKKERPTGTGGYERRETSVQWIEATEGTEVVPFEVETSDGTVLVRGEPSLKIMDDRTQETVDGDATPPDEIRSFLEDPRRAAADGSSIDLSDVDTDQTLRYTENLVVPGETVFVMGTGRSTLDAGPDLDVDAVVTAPEDGLTDRLPDRLWRFDFFVADKPMDETVRAMRWVGALGVAVGVVLLAGAAYVVA